jgi:hypothetical protein
MKFQDEIIFISNRHKNRSYFLLTAALTVLITILLSDFIMSSTLSPRTAIAALPGVQPGNATTATIRSNTLALASTNATAKNIHLMIDLNLFLSKLWIYIR